MDFADESRISRMGVYGGYSAPQYASWVRRSQYVMVRDGTRLALDRFHPARQGQPAEPPLPTLWMHWRYQRASCRDGQFLTPLDLEPWLCALLHHGYILCIVDARGTGASYGTAEPFSPAEIGDLYDITEWIAGQPWCDGNVGMCGISYAGIAQYLAASVAPPHLKAIFPIKAAFDAYDFFYPGGIYQHKFTEHWNSLVRSMDFDETIVPVDEDPAGTMLREAINQHDGNRYYDLCAGLPYRDSMDEITHSPLFLTRSPYQFLDAIRRSRIPIYHMGCWYDMCPQDGLLWFQNLNNPQKLIIGPWCHNDFAGFDLASEHLRWFDYWLKGVDNGIMAEPPIHYAVLDAPEDQTWQTTWSWPPPGQQEYTFYLDAGPTESISSVNDGALSAKRPQQYQDADAYTVDYTTTISEEILRGYAKPSDYPDMTNHGHRGLTYTSQALERSIEVCGAALVTLWVSSSAADADFFVYLQEVRPDGFSAYVTEGRLRASHRALSPPPYNAALPYHRSFACDVAPLHPEPTVLMLALAPVAKVFRVGSRVRVTVTCANADTESTPWLEPPPQVWLHRGTEWASQLLLPCQEKTHHFNIPAK